MWLGVEVEPLGRGVARCGGGAIGEGLGDGALTLGLPVKGWRHQHKSGKGVRQGVAVFLGKGYL